MTCLTMIEVAILIRDAEITFSIIHRILLILNYGGMDFPFLWDASNGLFCKATGFMA